MKTDFLGQQLEVGDYVLTPYMSMSPAPFTFYKVIGETEKQVRVEHIMLKKHKTSLTYGEKLIKVSPEQMTFWMLKK